jgi:transposase
MKHYPQPAVERAMKIQEIILKAVGHEITWIEAAEIIGISPRSMRRWKQRYLEYGYDGLFDRRLRRPSPKRVPLKTVEKILTLYRDRYYDFNVKHFHEEMTAKHGVTLSYTWVRTCLQTAGLVAKRRKRGTHRKRRPRRPLPGMMLHMDGSFHPWFAHRSDPRQTLLAIIDDATTKTYAACFVPHEATVPVMELLWEVVEEYGIFCSFYTDKASHFTTTRHGGPHQRQSANGPTQIERALAELGIQTIKANSPEARGRMERLFGTWQGRLPQELRLRRITTYKSANRYLRDVFIPKHNRQFTVKPLEQGTAFVPCHRDDLDRVFSIHHQRTVEADNTVSVANMRLQIEQSPLRVSFDKCRVTVYQHLDGSFSIGYGPHCLGRYRANGKITNMRATRKEQRQGIESLIKHSNRTDHLLQKAAILTSY